MKCLVGSFALFAFALSAQAAETGFIDKVHTDADGKTAKYVVFVPKDYDGKKEYPVILFLHGSGETGTDGKKQVGTGIGTAIKKMPDFGFITILPQSHKRTWQAGSDDANRALAMLETTQKEYKTDSKRIYLTGLSMGGYGTWSLAAKYPEKWAAIVPICGGGNPADAAKFKDIPCWNFHGDDDKAVKVEKSREMIKALKDAGGHPEYTEYPGVGHNSWDKAYATKELYPWLLKHSKK